MTAAGAQTIEIDGRRLAWRTVGSGPPLLLVNGYAATGGDWDPQLLQRLGESFELISPDNRGMGRSQLGDPAGLTIDGMADLERCSTRRDRPPARRRLVDGRPVAQRLALWAPARERLVLLASDPGGRPPSPPTQPCGHACSTTPAAPEQATRLICCCSRPRWPRRSTTDSARSSRLRGRA
jgi:pimeloyl-ACP methyl ester carboxylesterase